jgi:hypothetical protein
LDCITDPELTGKVFNDSLSIGSDKIWSFDGLQLLTSKPTADSGLASNCNFKVYWMDYCVKAAKGTPFERPILNAFSTGDLSIFEDFQFVAQVVPVLTQTGEKRTRTSKKDASKSFTIDVRVPSSFVSLAGVSAKGSGSRPKNTATTAAANDSSEAFEKILGDEDTVAKISQILTEKSGRSMALVKAALKKAEIDVNVVMANLAEFGYEEVGGKLAEVA